MGRKKIITVLVLVSLTAIVIKNNSVSTISNSKKYLGKQQYTNAELTTIVNEMRAKVNRLKAEKADQDDLETAQTLAYDVESIVGNIASQSDYDATVSTANQASSKAAEVKERADDMQSKLNDISTMAGQINSAVNNAATPANVETVASVAETAKIDAAAANSDVADANDIIAAANNEVSDKASLSQAFNAIYPVGSIYMSYSSTSPATLFGGTWTQIQNGALVGYGSSYSGYDLGVTYGSNIVDISHYHYPGTYAAAIGSNSSSANTLGFIATYDYGYGESTYYLGFSSYTAGTSFNHFTKIYGTTTTASIRIDKRMPYFLVYMWRRTA